MKRSPIIVYSVLVACIAGAMVEWSNRTAIAVSRSDFESYDHRDGKKEAEADIARGAPKWKVYGLQRATELRGMALRKDVGLELDWFQGCIVSEGIEKYAYDYNSVVWKHVVSLYGEDVVHESLGDPPQKPSRGEEEANQALEPTAMSVTSRAAHEPRQP